MTESRGASTIAVAQFAPTADTAANLDTIRALTADAVAGGAGLVVFPEYSSSFVAEPSAEWIASAETLDGPFVAAIAALAVESGAHIVAGMLERTTASDKVANTLVALAPSGERVASYRKLHLYDAFGSRESDWMLPGELTAPQTFAWEGFTVGLQTCYDIRFPEVSRHLVDAGADLLLVPAEWVRGPLKEQHWRTLVTARAIENTVYVAAADHAPPVGIGNSMIVDPMGVELATIGEVTDVALARISRERLSAVREKNPALALRRFAVVPKPSASHAAALQ